MKFHILGIPHTATNLDHVHCAFTQKVYKFCEMMHARGHEIIHYGRYDSNPPCSKHISTSFNNDIQYNELNTSRFKELELNTINAIGENKTKNDFILPFWGAPMANICNAHSDLITVEPGIGYPTTPFANYKVFESYSILSAYCGMASVATCQQKWYDVVIPNYFDVSQFEYREEKDDYFLMLGRLYDGKGLNIVIQLAEKLPIKVKLAGQLSPGINLPDNVEYVGEVKVEARKELLAGARALLAPSLFLEPFCGVQIEAMLSGTPVISSDWGAFAEYNIHGKTGYRCRTFEHFVWAVRNIYKINSKKCKEWADNFSYAKIAPKYEEFFVSLLNIYNGKGWYEENDSRLELDWLNLEQ